MVENEFWEIIEVSGSPDKCTPDEQCENIIEKLSEKSKDELVSFANIHKKLLCKSYIWSMLKANFILISYISDDAFEDFRNWVILNGKERFYKTIENPDSIAGYINVEDAVEEVTGEALLYVCEEAWDGDVEVLEENYEYHKDPEIDDDWPPAEKLAEEFPNLYKEFWNEENIRTLS